MKPFPEIDEFVIIQLKIIVDVDFLVFGEFLVFFECLRPFSSVSGGKVSVTKCQSVIDNPELVKRVMPPTTTITNNNKQPESNQIITDLFLFFILLENLEDFV